MIKSVEASKYDKKYFQDLFDCIDYNKLKDISEFDRSYRIAGSLLKLAENDKIVDFGCGAGQLVFHLYMKYRCRIIGIDYSPDAIYFCDKNLNILKNRPDFSGIENQVKFLCADNNHLPVFNDIKAVYLLDVLEHLYDEEIRLILAKFKTWKNREGIYLIIHTDNNNYLKFVRPVLNIISVILGKTTFQKIRENKKWNCERHINLTTAAKLERKFQSLGFQVLKIEYPVMDIDVLKAHLGAMGQVKIILYLVYFSGKIFYFLRPSFYMLAKY